MGCSCMQEGSHFISRMYKQTCPIRVKSCFTCSLVRSWILMKCSKDGLLVLEVTTINVLPT